MNKEEYVFITGTSSGLGLGLAKAYLEDGLCVQGCSRREAPDVLKANANYTHHIVDLTDYERISDLLNAVCQVGVPSLVVLNAGVLGEIQDLKDYSLDELKQVMEVNLWSNKVLIDELCSGLNSLSQIVAISSGASVNGNRGWGGYSLSKAALNMLIRIYASEFPQIHFSSLAPGLIDTAMQDYLCSRPSEGKFHSLDRLNSARGTDDMPNPEIAGRRIKNAIEKIPQFDSGAFLDVRKDFE